MLIITDEAQGMARVTPHAVEYGGFGGQFKITAMSELTKKNENTAEPITELPFQWGSGGYMLQYNTPGGQNVPLGYTGSIDAAIAAMNYIQNEYARGTPVLDMRMPIDANS
jgi:hypothetical protein